MNKEELISAMSDMCGLSKADTRRALDAYIEVTKKTLKKGGDVRLVGFGTFSKRKKAASKGRNPRTGKEIKIPASFRVKFSVGKALKDAVN